MSTAFTKLEDPAALVPDRESRDPAPGLPERTSSLIAQPEPPVLTGERLLAAEALRLLIRLDRDLLEARAQWNQDWFRRVMRIRPKAVIRLRRRWAKFGESREIALGGLRRRYHANLAGYLYEPRS